MCPVAVAALQAARYNIGGSDYVLDDLENGILRGNAPGAASLGMLLKLPWLSKGPFKQGDPRAQHVSLTEWPVARGGGGKAKTGSQDLATAGKGLTRGGAPCCSFHTGS